MFNIEKIVKDSEFLNSCDLVQRCNPSIKLLVKVSDDEKPTFFYDFFGTLFKINDATHVQLLNNLNENDGFTSQIVFVLTEQTLYIISFCSYHKRNDILSKSSASFKYLTYIDTAHLPSYIITTSKKFFGLARMHYVFIDGWYYLSWDLKYHLAADKNAVIVKFNHHDAVTYFVPSNANLIKRENTHNNLPKYVITTEEIFDVDSFRVFSLKNLFSTFKLYYKNLFFRIFSTPSARKLLFVYKNDINFHNLRNTKSSYFSKGAYTDGLIYDLDTQKLVLANEKEPNNPWLKFYLYDDGIPHVFKTVSENGENIFNIVFYDYKKNKFSSVISKSKPFFVSYHHVDNTLLSTKTRYIFMTAENKENHEYPESIFSEELSSVNLMIAVDEELSIVNADSYLQLKSVIFANDDLPIVNITKLGPRAFYLSGNDAIILKSYKGEFGEFVLMHLNNGTRINYSLSFFDYQRVLLTMRNKNVSSNCYTNSKYLKVICAQSDFENETYIINLKTHDTYTVDEFVDHISKNFSECL